MSFLFRSTLSGGEANYDDFGTNVMGNFAAPAGIKATRVVDILLENYNYNYDDLDNFNEPVTIGKYVTDCSDLFSSLLSFNQPVSIPPNTTNLAVMFDHSGFNCPIEFPFSNIPNESNELSPVPPSSGSGFIIEDGEPPIVDLTWMFAYSNFNQPINNFPSLFNGSGMFFGSNFNCPIDFSNSTTYSLSAMFQDCTYFNQPVEIHNINLNYETYYADIDGTRYGYGLGSMFEGCRNFNSPVTFNGNSNLFGAVSFYRMFCNSAFNCPIDFSNIEASERLDFVETFGDTRRNPSVFNQPIVFPYVSTYIIFGNTFGQVFNQPINIDGAEWARLNLINGYFVPHNFNQPINISPNLMCDNFYGAFEGCAELNQPINLPTFDLKDDNINYECNIDNLFIGCTKFNQPLIFNFYTPTPHNTTISMRYAMSYCSNFNSPINFNIEPYNDHVNIDASYFFYECSHFSPTLDTFEEGEAFLPKWITNATGMFKRCGQFRVNHISIPRDAVNCYEMFSGCFHVNHIHIYKEDSFDFENFCLDGLLGGTFYFESKCEILIDENSSPKTYNAIIGANIFDKNHSLSWINESWGSYNTEYNIYVIQDYDNYVNWTP